MSVLPVPRSIYERAVLIDTGALIAINDPRDRYRQDAVQLFADLINLAYPLYVTPQTIAETHRQLLYKPHLSKAKASKFLQVIYDSSINIERPTQEDELKAIEYISRFENQTLTFTDAISMAVMSRIGIRKIFAFDWHFTLLGFQLIPPLY